MTYKKQHDAQQEEANLSPAEQADRQAWDNALRSTSQVPGS